MASSDNLIASYDPWTFKSSWFSEAFARDTEILTKALQHSISNNTGISGSGDFVKIHETTSSHHQTQSFRDTEILTKALQHSLSNNTGISGSGDFVTIHETTSSLHQTQSFSSSGGGGGGGSETESVSKRVPFRNAVNVIKGKVSKRKSRASKRSPTTFITADPENFRQMVQQVTGIRFSNGPGSGLGGSVVKPEPQRPVGGCGGFVNRVQTGCVLPTLDTSAFLLDNDHQEEQVVGPGTVDFGLGSVVGEANGPGFDFDGFSGFPILDSWN